MKALVDTHAHLDGLAGGFDAIAAALDRARDRGVTRLVAVGGNPDGNRIALQAARQWPDRIRAAVGFDRYCAGRPDLDDATLAAQLDSPEVAAVGEIGLDFHYAADSADAQNALFRRMLDRAAERRLPVVVHCREAEDAMGPLLEEHAARWAGDPLRIGVIHCFTGSVPFAQRAMACGFHVSFSGILTFPKADNVRTAALAVPEDRLLVETDTPYLAPVPHRGKPNEPQWVEQVLLELARVKNSDPERLAAVTTANAVRLFGL